MELFALGVIILLVLLATLFVVAEVYMVIVSHLFGAPFVPSKKERIVTMMKLASIKTGDVVYDLGSGDGSLLIESTRRGARAIGIEINPLLVLWSRWRVRRAHLSPTITIHFGDFRNYPLHDANVVFVYLLPKTIVRIQEKFITELAPGTRIVSNSFAIEGWRHDWNEDGVFSYRMPPELL